MFSHLLIEVKSNRIEPIFSHFLHQPIRFLSNSLLTVARWKEVSRLWTYVRFVYIEQNVFFRILSLSPPPHSFVVYCRKNAAFVFPSCTFPVFLEGHLAFLFAFFSVVYCVKTALFKKLLFQPVRQSIGIASYIVIRRENRYLHSILFDIKNFLFVFIVGVFNTGSSEKA